MCSRAAWVCKSWRELNVLYCRCSLLCTLSSIFHRCLSLIDLWKLKSTLVALHRLQSFEVVCVGTSIAPFAIVMVVLVHLVGEGSLKRVPHQQFSLIVALYIVSCGGGSGLEFFLIVWLSVESLRVPQFVIIVAMPFHCFFVYTVHFANAGLQI